MPALLTLDAFRRVTRPTSGPVLGLLALALLPAAGSAAVSDRLYEFTDAYYRANGVDPDRIEGRREADGILARADTPLFSFQRNVRALFTIGGWNEGGKPAYWTVFGGISAAGFTNDAAGRAARALADRSPEYVFPKRGTNPLALNAVRQPFMIDTRNGYFGKDPLGLWIHVYVNWTDAAFDTSNGRKAIADLTKRNGLGLDGTPIIRTVSEIDSLAQNGFVTKSTLPLDDRTRYGLCPAIKDPRDGGIARDQWLATVNRPDGTALVPEILRNFESLRLTGRPAN